MAILTVPDHNITLTGADEIRVYLQARGIWFDQWQASCEFLPEATQEEVLEAYAPSLKPYMEAHGYQTADVVCVHSNTPNLPEIRAKFLKEHTHSEDEVRFFVEGRGYFWFNLEGNEPVFCMTCEAGDLLSVPAGVKHWFDLGEPAWVKAIRIFIDPAGWVPEYTESGVESRYQGVTP